MNPISTFQPTVGAHVHDALNDNWMTFTAGDVESMEREVQEYGRARGIENWDGFILDGWLPADVQPVHLPRKPEIPTQLSAIRVALRAKAMDEFSLSTKQVETIIAEARGEALAEALKVVGDDATLSAADRERLLERLRAVQNHVKPTPGPS